MDDTSSATPPPSPPPSAAAPNPAHPSPPVTPGWRLAYGQIAAALLAAALVIAIGVAVPLQVASLKKEKAEATMVPPQVKVHRPPQYGVASWYGDHEAGKLTASGSTFKPDRLTAAHRWLPLGSKVRVTRIGSKAKRSTVVTINDRGPYIGGRVIDLSPAAARQLAMVDKGLARVRIDVISEPSPATQLVKRAIRKTKKPPRPDQLAEPPPAKKSQPDNAQPHRPSSGEQQADAQQAAPVDAKPADAKSIEAKPEGSTPAPIAEPESINHFP